MSSFIATGSYLITIQEGNPIDILFIVPDEIVMTNRKAKLQIRKTAESKAIITIDTDGGQIAKNLQTLICSYTAAQSIGNSGKYVWDLAVYTTADDAITIGRGAVTIIPRISHV